jgi:hypothetical protein
MRRAATADFCQQCRFVGQRRAGAHVVAHGGQRVAQQLGHGLAAERFDQGCDRGVGEQAVDGGELGKVGGHGLTRTGQKRRCVDITHLSG